MTKRSQRALRYRVCRGPGGMWDVLEVGVAAAVASFHEHGVAAAYARRLAERRGGEVLADGGRRPGAA